MSLFAHIESSISMFWHADLQPWLKNLLTSVVHHEVDALIPLATTAVDALAQELIASHGDLEQFASVANQILTQTAAQAKIAAIQAGGSSLLTAVTAAISAHPSQSTNPNAP